MKSFSFIIKKIIKISVIFSFFFLLSYFFSEISFAAEAGNTKNSGFVFLENFGDKNAFEEIKEAVDDNKSALALSLYINFLIKIALSLGFFLSVALIIMGGIKYTISETFTEKSDGRDEVTRAIGALIIFFASFIVFASISPELLKVRFKPLVNSSETFSTEKLFFGNNVGRITEAGFAKYRNEGWKPICGKTSFWSFDSTDAKKCVTEFISFSEKNSGTHFSEPKNCVFVDKGSWTGIGDKYCFFIIKKEDKDNNDTDRGRLNEFNKHYKLAKKEKYVSSQNSSNNLSEDEIKTSCENIAKNKWKKNPELVYGKGECYCRTWKSKEICTYFVRNNRQRRVAALQKFLNVEKMIKDTVGESYTLSDGTSNYQTKDACQNSGWVTGKTTDPEMKKFYNENEIYDNGTCFLYIELTSLEERSGNIVTLLWDFASDGVENWRFFYKKK